MARGEHEHDEYVTRLDAVDATIADLTSRIEALEQAEPPPPPPDPDPEVLWHADMEDGTLNAFDGAIKSGPGVATPTVTTYAAYQGNYGLDLELDTRAGKAGVRMKYEGSDLGLPPDKNLPDDAYYSAWFWVPPGLVVPWLNLHQWKQKNNGGGKHLYSASMSTRGDGTQRLELATKVHPDGSWGSPTYNIAESYLDVPIGRWFHLEQRYLWHPTDGIIQAWLDGEIIWNAQGIKTDMEWPVVPGNVSRQVAWNNYSINTSPAVYSIYLDDARVTTERWFRR